MTYNYDFELAAFFFLTCILLHFLINRQQPLERTRIFFFIFSQACFWQVSTWHPPWDANMRTECR